MSLVLLLAIFMILLLKFKVDEKYRRYPGSLDSDFTEQPYRQGSPFKYATQNPGVTGLSVRGIGGPY